MATRKPWGVVLALAGVLVLGAWASASAELKASSAEVVRATGRVEVLRKGQAQWAGASVGARLGEGDQIRALSAASAELALADGSTILVAENTRFAVTKLDYDAQTRERDASFHLVAGKVRAEVTRAAVQLVRARQSNFNISTPTGVAAIRGTVSVIAFDPVTLQAVIFSFPSAGESPAAARVTWVNFATGTSVTVPGGQFTTQVGTANPAAPTPVSNLPANVQAAIQTATNPTTANNPALTAPTTQIVIVTPQQIQQILVAVGIQAPPAPPTAAPAAVAPTVSTVGQDITQTQQQKPASP